MTRNFGRFRFRNDPVQALGLRRLKRLELLVRLELLQPQQLDERQDVPVVEI